VALPGHARWSELLISWADSCITLQLPAAWSAPPQVRCCSLSLNAALRFRRSALWFTSCPALEVDFCCAYLLGFPRWGLISLPHPLSLGQAQCSVSPLCCQCYESSLLVVLFCEAVWLWVLLTGSGDDLCDLLPALLHGLAPLPSCLFSFCLLIVCTEINSLLLPLSLVYFQHSWFLCCCARLQFTVCYSVFLGRGQSTQGLFWFIPGVDAMILHDAWHSPVCSVKCLAHRFGVSGGSCSGDGNPQVFSV
jgi:hypothetical protein